MCDSFDMEASSLQVASFFSRSLKDCLLSDSIPVVPFSKDGAVTCDLRGSGDASR